jgi:hypothetical protein
LLAAAAYWFGRDAARIAAQRTAELRGRASVADRLAQYGPAARARLAPAFAAAGVAYPPARLALVGLKDKMRLEVWAADAAGPFRFVTAYSILAASGELGPKLREGDLQTPEGVYRIEALNPNSRFHLSLRLNYPNDFDQYHARREGRSKPGSDIMIHGGAVSIGCLAMGDPAIEELFTLTAETGRENVRVILSPTDFRTPGEFQPAPDAPTWTAQLYAEIRRELAALQ